MSLAWCMMPMEPSLAPLRAPPLWGHFVICNLNYSVFLENINQSPIVTATHARPYCQRMPEQYRAGLMPLVAWWRAPRYDISVTNGNLLTIVIPFESLCNTCTRWLEYDCTFCSGFRFTSMSNRQRNNCNTSNSCCSILGSFTAKSFTSSAYVPLGSHACHHRGSPAPPGSLMAMSSCSCSVKRPKSKGLSSLPRLAP